MKFGYAMQFVAAMHSSFYSFYDLHQVKGLCSTSE